MEKSELMDALRNSGAKDADLFNCNGTMISYKTGIPVLDYYLGYIVNVYDKEDNLIESRPEIGIPAGSMATFIGKPSTSKTSTAVCIAANIIRDFKNGAVFHFDLEQAMNYSRIHVLTRLKMSEIADRYVLRQEKTTLEHMKKTIMTLYREKMSNPKLYKYKTGKKDEFGEEIEIFEPTVIILDSIASITMGLNENNKDDLAKLEEVSSQTDRMRLTGEIGRFYNEILPYLRTANIIMLNINQIKVNPNMGFAKSPAEILYLKPEETAPGGRAPQFLAHTLIKYESPGSDKYSMEKEGFDGFGVNATIIKSRTNQAGQIVQLIYDKVRGIDSLRTCVQYAKSLGLTGGNKNKFYFADYPDRTFTLTNIHEDFRNDRELYKILYSVIIPRLAERLSTVSEEEREVVQEEMDY